MQTVAAWVTGIPRGSCSLPQLCGWHYPCRGSRSGSRIRRPASSWCAANASIEYNFSERASSCCWRFGSRRVGSIKEIPYAFSSRDQGVSKATFRVACEYAELLAKLYWERFGFHRSM